MTEHTTTVKAATVPTTRTPETAARSVPELVERARRLAERGGRCILGVTGAPGAGKTTLARTIAAELGPQRCALVPMDGFHLTNATLLAWGRRDRKGAWDTFDVDGYVHLLRRLHDRTEKYVHAPDYDRDIAESIGSAIPVHRGVPLILTEGNYLLAREGAWSGVEALLDESWFVELDDLTRRERLVRRHEQHGMNHHQAVEWTGTTDQANAVLITASRDRADLAVTVVVREDQRPMDRMAQ